MLLCRVGPKPGNGNLKMDMSHVWSQKHMIQYFLNDRALNTCAPPSISHTHKTDVVVVFLKPSSRLSQNPLLFLPACMQCAGGVEPKRQRSTDKKVLIFSFLFVVHHFKIAVSFSEQGWGWRWRDGLCDCVCSLRIGCVYVSKHTPPCCGQTSSTFPPWDQKLTTHKEHLYELSYAS